MDLIFYIVVAAELLLSLWSLIQGFQWLAMSRRRAGQHSGFFTPRVALLCPCKGIEFGLEENLNSLIAQDYPNYEIFFILARADDAAATILKRVTTASAAPAHIVIAGRAQGCGEKVNNLRVAIDQLDASFNVVVFADSDGRPGRQWLTHLVAPLNDPRLGATTTFRWWLPIAGGFFTALGAAWDASIVTMLGEHNRNFCWGGGTAMRLSVFDEVKVKDHWAGAVSDDWGITNALRAAGRQIQFVPECLVPTLHDADAKSLLDFTNRQITITRVYASKVWFAGAFSHFLYCAAIILGIAQIIQLISIGQLWLSNRARPHSDHAPRRRKRNRPLDRRHRSSPRPQTKTPSLRLGLDSPRPHRPISLRHKFRHLRLQPTHQMARHPLQPEIRQPNRNCLGAVSISLDNKFRFSSHEIHTQSLVY